MDILNGQVGELYFTIEITRAETGETETVELVGKIPTTDKQEEDDR